MSGITIAGNGVSARAACAIGARLGMAFPTPQFEHAMLPAKLTPAIWTNLLRRTPFVGVGWMGISQVDTARAMAGEENFMVALVTQNKAKFPAVLMGDAFAPGLFDMVDACCAILHGYTIPGIGTVQVTNAVNSFAEGIGEDHAIALVQARVRVALSVGTVFQGPDLTPIPMETSTWTWNFSDGYTLVSDEDDT